MSRRRVHWLAMPSTLIVLIVVVAAWTTAASALVGDEIAVAAMIVMAVAVAVTLIVDKMAVAAITIMAVAICLSMTATAALRIVPPWVAVALVSSATAAVATAFAMAVTSLVHGLPLPRARGRREGCPGELCEPTSERRSWRARTHGCEMKSRVRMQKQSAATQLSSPPQAVDLHIGFLRQHPRNDVSDSASGVVAMIIKSDSREFCVGVRSQ